MAHSIEHLQIKMNGRKVKLCVSIAHTKTSTARFFLLLLFSFLSFILVMFLSFVMILIILLDLILFWGDIVRAKGSFVGTGG